MSETYENIKNKIEKELEQLNESGIISTDEKISLSGNLVSYDKKQNYIDVSEPPTSNERSHSLYGKENDYLNKKLINSESGKVYIKTENNLYLKNKEDGEVELINKENIENEDDITWTILGSNSNYVRFANKHGIYLRAYNNLTVKTPVLINGKDDTETNSNLWKLIKKDNVYLLENSFYKNNLLDNTLKISESETDSKRWILESIPLNLNIYYPLITTNYIKDKEKIINTYIKYKNKIIDNKILIIYLDKLKKKAFLLKPNKDNNTTILFQKEKKKYIQIIELLQTDIRKENELINKKFTNNNEYNQLEKNKEEFISNLINVLNKLKANTYKNKNQNYLTINNIKQQYNKSNKSSNNINFINEKSLVMDDNIFIFKKNNHYLKKKKNILFIFIILFCIVLMGFAINIINDIYKLYNNI